MLSCQPTTPTIFVSLSYYSMVVSVTTIIVLLIVKGSGIDTNNWN